MSTQIERLRYFQGEYLQSFDFEAEQDYHIEMRRRLNMSLHLYGIVEGLEITQSQNGSLIQCSINAGMAIDAYGREIYVFAPHIIDSVDLGNAKVPQSGGTYLVYVQYKRTANTPPTGGFGQCNGQNQYTRWNESYDVLLSTTELTPTVLPTPMSPIPDDATNAGWPVKLGTVIIKGPLDIEFKDHNGRVYIGLRAQQIVAPTLNVTPVPTFDVLGTTIVAGPTDPPPAVEVESNLFADQNLVVGTNFAVNPPPKAPLGQTVPKLLGNAKIAGDLYLQGEIYKANGNVWLNTADLIASFVPEFKAGFADIPITEPNAGALYITDTFVAQVQSQRIANPSSAQVLATLAGFQLVPWASGAPPHDINSIQTVATAANLDPSLEVQVQATITPVSPPPTASWNINLKWTAAPSALFIEAGIHNFYNLFTHIFVNYIVIFFP